MKILQITNFFKPSWEAGGVARVCYEISTNLVRRNHEVTVYTTDGFNPRLDVQTNKALELEGIKVYYFYNLSNFLVQKFILTTPYYLPFILRKEIQSFDIIHIHEHRTLSAALIHYYAKKNSIPYVLQSHGSVLPFFQKSKLKKVFDYLFGYNILKNASKVIALTEIEAKQYLQMGVDESKISIIPNGIHIEEFKDLPEKGEFRKKNSIESDEKIVLYLGRIDKIKGIDLLIEAYSDLMQKVDRCRLVIVGPSSNYLPVLKDQIVDSGIDSNILFTGPLYERDKLEVYVDADVLVYPSSFEIFGLVPIEAIMCGTPVIITDCCGCSDLVSRLKCGYLVNYGDVEELKDKIVKLIEKLDEEKNTIKSCQQYISDNLVYDKIVEEMEKVYENCIYNV